MPPPPHILAATGAAARSSSSSSSSSSRRSKRSRSHVVAPSVSSSRSSSDRMRSEVVIHTIDIQGEQIATSAGANSLRTNRRSIFLVLLLLLLLVYAGLVTRSSWSHLLLHSPLASSSKVDAAARIESKAETSIISPSPRSSSSHDVVSDVSSSSSLSSSSSSSSSLSVPSACLSTPLPLLCAWGFGGEWNNSEEEEQKERKQQLSSLYVYRVELGVVDGMSFALVSISLRDLCCSPGPAGLPDSYFRVTVRGTAQTAADTPIRIGERGENETIQHSSLSSASCSVSSSRCVVSRLLLPDFGVYWLEVRLLHFNASRSMLTHTFPAGNTRAYEQQQGEWVDGIVCDEKGRNGTKITLHYEEKQAKAYRERWEDQKPLCGSQEDERRRAESVLANSSLPLAGRWKLHTSASSQPSSSSSSVPLDASLLSAARVWLVENSVWTPFFCRLSDDVSLGHVLRRLQWLHVMGDSNSKVFFRRFLCPLANGTVLEADPRRMPGKLDPPSLCMGSSAEDNQRDADTGRSVASSPHWLLTYSHWHWPKPTLLEVEPSNGEWSFRQQCARYVEDAKPGVVIRGWPQCVLAPPLIKQKRGPGVTWFSWGSHAAHMADSEETRQLLASEELIGLPFFRQHAAVFPLTSAIEPSLIPAKFGRQQRMRNNERIAVSNQLLIQTIRQQEQRQRVAETETQTRKDHVPPISPSSSAWLPVLDLFSPTHAAYESLTGDAVHFHPFLYEQQIKWLAHLLHHAPNYRDE